MVQRVLLVDSDVDALATAEGWLKEANYETTTATTFAGAKAAISAGPFDVLIADVRLGAYNGIHLALLARSRARQLRTIVTHAERCGALKADAHSAGARVFIAKPLTRWSLLSAVEAAAHAEDNGPAAVRRWPRVRLTKSWEGRIADEAARVLDVSYGGVRVELTHRRDDGVDSPVNLELTEPALSVGLRPVWIRRSGLPGSCWFGAEIANVDSAEEHRWRTLVDSLAPM
jgi:DNA-binding response OmpR family regulator